MAKAKKTGAVKAPKATAGDKPSVELKVQVSEEVAAVIAAEPVKAVTPGIQVVSDAPKVMLLMAPEPISQTMTSHNTGKTGRRVMAGPEGLLAGWVGPGHRNAAFLDRHGNPIPTPDQPCFTAYSIKSSTFGPFQTAEDAAYYLATRFLSRAEYKTSFAPGVTSHAPAKPVITKGGAVSQASAGTEAPEDDGDGDGETDCPECEGSGEINGETCPECDGSGTI
jgi:hypothetical protein